MQYLNDYKLGKLKKYSLIFLVILFTINIQAQGDFCIESMPFSTSETLTYPAGVNSGNGEPGANYGCLGSEPNPAWYHMRISVAGDIMIQMTSTPSQDIDFIMWGPFADQYNPCTDDLTASKIVDCSYSPSPVEDCTIPDALVGEYYILLITNFSNQYCTINAEKVGGDGESDFDIINSEVSSNSPICIGDALELYAESVEDASYSWMGPNGFTSVLQNPIIPDAQLENDGIYTLTITLEGIEESYDANVVIIQGSDFEITDLENNAESVYNICTEEVIRFKITPFSNTGTAWWNGGDDGEGEISEEFNTSTEITATVENYFGCISERTVELIVYEGPILSFETIPSICQGSGIYTITQGSSTSTGTGIYAGDYINEAGEFDTDNATVGQHEITYVFTDENDCVNSITQTINVILGPQTPTSIQVNRPSYCSNNPPSDGTIKLISYGIDNVHYWYANDFSGSPIGDQKTIIIPAPTETTTYLVRSETDCGNSDSLTITVTVHPSPETAFSFENGCQGAEVSFDNNSILTAEIDYWTWIFGDGTANSDLEDPNHIYAEPGTFDVTLRVFNEFSCYDILEQTIEIFPTPQAPTSIDVANPDHLEYCSDEAVDIGQISLICQGPDNDNGYFWYKGDLDGSSIGNSKTLSIDAPTETTTYIVRSENDGDCGESESLNITVTVNTSPIADFTKSEISQGQPINFSDLSSQSGTGEIVNWEWDFGDGTSSNEQNPSHTYINSGSYTVTLTITNSNACQDSYTEILEVFTGETVISISPSSQTVYVAGIFTTNIEISNVVNLGGFELDLPFDPDLLQVNSVELEDFLGSSGRTLFPLKDNIDNDLGIIEYGIVTLDNNPPGPNGNGLLLSIEWAVTSDLETASTIDLLLQDVQLIEPNGTPISFEIENASVTLNPCYVYDLDCDCDVDIVDVTMVAYVYDTEEGDEGYNLLYDFDNDGDIDIIDVTLVAYNYGWECEENNKSALDFGGDNSQVELSLIEKDFNEKDFNEEGIHELDIYVENIHQLGAYELGLLYEKENIEIIELANGGFLEQSERQNLLLKDQINEYEGTIHYAITSLGSHENGANGSGSLLKLYYKSKNSQDGIPFSIVNVQLTRVDAELIDFKLTTNDQAIEELNDDHTFIISTQPNPFTIETKITYHLGENGLSSFKIYDIYGKLLLETERKYQKKGNYHFDFRKEGLSHGIYMVTLVVEGGIMDCKRIIIN